jgi:hypothetical protein
MNNGALIRQLAKVEQWQENAGDTKRMGHTKAYLSFVDATEKVENDKIDKKGKGPVV